MRRPFMVAAAAAALVFAGAQSAAAQGRRGPARYDVNTVRTVAGRIMAVDSLPSPRGLGGGLHVQLKAGDTTYEVHLGPQSYLQGKSMRLAVGDEVKVTGSLITYQQREVLLAASVTKASLTVMLRDSTGVPLWAGRRGGMRMR